MGKLLRIKYFQFIERLRQEGFLSALRFSLYKREEAVPVMKDLATLHPVKDPGGALPKIIELGPENFASQGLHYPLRSRHERVERYFRLGYRSYAMVRDGVVIGDLWYVTRGTSDHEPLHPHLRWFGIDLGPDEVYMFDMQVNQEERGNSLTTWFLTSVLHRLRDSGHARAYGYFAAHNVPALWVHRLVGYKEMPHFVVRRFLLYETAHAKG